jgi:Antibiotic biosynthesis monooxygenase
MRGDDMTAFNVVRFKVRPGSEKEFVDAHRKMRPTLKGFIGGGLIRTGDQSFCMVGEWRSFKSIVNARPQMVALLDSVRGMLEDLGGGLGVTDPVSGEVAVKFSPPKKKAVKAKAKLAKTRSAAKRAIAKLGARKSAAGKRAPAKKR